MLPKVTENPSFRKALRSAYLSREKEGIGDDWPLKVMRRVREIGPVTIPGFWPDFEQLVWRLAPVSGILVLAVAVLLLLNIGSGFSDDYLGIVTSDLDQPTMGELLGLES
jgi:hypothetical protein